jgi:hypothetical protein
MFTVTFTDQVHSMEADGESVLPDPARKISSLVREERDRYLTVMNHVYCHIY